MCCVVKNVHKYRYFMRYCQTIAPIFHEKRVANKRLEVCQKFKDAAWWRVGGSEESEWALKGSECDSSPSKKLILYPRNLSTRVSA
jgi:hypothetical protein